MAFTADGASTRKTARSVDLSWDSTDATGEQRPPRDWKKLFLVIGLGGLSWVATYVGLLELIEANMGDLPLIHKAIVGFSVAMLMVMVVWLLDQMFSDNGWIARALFAAGYVFLTIISVGFGFGFYWKMLESRSEASRSAESAIGQVQTSLHAAMTRLEQLQSTLDGLTTVSSQKADLERQAGTSCSNSKPGDGPRRKLRDDDAGRFKFASDFVKGRVTSVKADIAALDTDLAKIVKDDKSTVDAKSGNRNDFMRNVGRKLDMTVVGFNAFRTDPQLKQIRVDLNERADKVAFVDSKGGTYSCPDGQLTTALKGVVRAIDELPALEKPKIAAVEGSEAVIEAFRRLTATFYGALSFKLPPSPEELRELQKKAVQSVESTAAQQAKVNAMAEQAGLSKRDYVPLAIAIFVDLCLLLVSMKKAGNRLASLVPKMRAAEQGPVIQILSRFNEIHRDKDIRENFEIFRHVVFDFHGDYYAAVPLNAPYRPNPKNGDQRQGYGVSDAHELLQQAHLLANLFASFEKEKIFTRVHSPLLSTKTVQKRLRRQGSKFANSEAFRLYRFRDGAWSDIILGAVMGAARRVEAEKRRRRVEEDIFDDASPTLDGRRPAAPASDAAFADAGPPPALEASERHRPAAGRQSPGETRPALDPAHAPAHPVAYPYVVAGSQFDAARRQQSLPPDPVPPGFEDAPPMIQPSRLAMAATFEAGRQGRPGRDGEVADRVQPHASNPGLAPSPPAASYSMARPPVAWPRPAPAASALLDAADEPVQRPANNNTAPDRRSGEVQHSGSGAGPVLPPPLPPMAAQHASSGENVVLHPAVSRPGLQAIAPVEGSLAMVIEQPAAPPVPPRPTVTVAATRETVTYTLPVSEAALPQALRKVITGGRPVTAGSAEAGQAFVTSEPAPSVRAAEFEPLALPAGDVEPAAWQDAHAAGFEAEQLQALEAAPALATTSRLAGEPAADGDDLRSIALRLRPARRDA